MEELDWLADRPDTIFAVFSFLGEEYSRRREKGSVLSVFGIHHDAIDSMVKGIKSIKEDDPIKKFKNNLPKYTMEWDRYIDSQKELYYRCVRFLP